MPNSIVLWRRAPSTRGLVAGLAILSVIVLGGVAHAAPPPGSFAGLAKAVSPAVVNIASTHEVTAAEETTPQLPFNFPEGSPFEKFFKNFQGQPTEPGQGGAEPHLVTGLGSGFIIDPDGYVVTNNHVVKDATKVEIKLEDNSVYTAKVIGTDPQTDVALLKFDAGRALPTVAFGNSDQAQIGDWVLAVGNPYGLGGTVTAGIISARGRNINAGPYDDFLQVDAAINRGNSGGPLFNLDGKVIGVNTAIYSPSGGSVGIGFAIPSNIVKSVVAQLRESGKVERGWLGVSIQNVSPEIADAIGLEPARGALVASVLPDSPAAQAKVERGDVILRFDGKSVANAHELAALVAAHPSGSRVDMTVWRDRGEKTLAVVTEEQPAKMAAAEAEPSSPGSYHSSALGADLAALTPERRQQYNVPEDVEGVVVLGVKGTEAYEQGLRPGDVIEEVGRDRVNSPDEVEKLAQRDKSKNDGSVLLLVNRQGQSLYLGLNVKTG
jgi:serine protease Do